MQKQYEMHNHPVAVPGRAARERMHVVFLENPPDAGTGNHDCMGLDFTYSYLESPLQYILFEGRSPCGSYPTNSK